MATFENIAKSMTYFLSKFKILPICYSTTICLFCFPNAIPDDPTTTNIQLLALRGKTEEVAYYIDEWVALSHRFPYFLYPSADIDGHLELRRMGFLYITLS